MEGGRVEKGKGGRSRTTLYKSPRHLALYNPCQNFTYTYFVSSSDNTPEILKGGGGEEGETHFIPVNLSYCNFSIPLRPSACIRSLAKKREKEESVNLSCDRWTIIQRP